MPRNVIRSHHPTVILMTTWNGASYVKQLISSINAQSDSNWVVMVRDDGSTDATTEILNQWASQDKRVILIKDDRGRLGSSAGFCLLMRQALESGAMYFAFCDQDDVWHESKLESLRQRLDLLDHGQPEKYPALSWSDLRWIDEEGGILAQSHFIASGGSRALSGGGLWLLSMNLIPGCAMLGNRALLELATSVKAVVSHHDWWTALVASACGHTGAVTTPLTDYRQHGGNQIGAASFSARLTNFASEPTRLLTRSARTYWDAVENARSLSRLPAPIPNLRWATAIDHTSTALGASSAWRRACAVLVGPVRRIGLLRNILMLFAAVSSPPRS